MDTSAWRCTKRIFFQILLCYFKNEGLATSPEAYGDKEKQCNRGDMRKIHVTRQFFEASGPLVTFSKKQKKKQFL